MKKIIKIKCEWGDYYDYRLIMSDASCHVRVSFFPDGQIIVSDLFVIEAQRRKGLATELLNEIEEMVGDNEITIVPSNKWQKKWYIKRGYKIVK